MQKYKEMIVQYGAIALVVHYSIFGVVLIAFWAAIRTGWKPENLTATVGTWTAAYLATKVTMPVRLAATLAVTPLAARLFERMTGKRRKPDTL